MNVNVTCEEKIFQGTDVFVDLFMMLKEVKDNANIILDAMAFARPNE